MPERTLGSECEIVMGQSPPGETCNESGIGIPLLNGPTEFGSHNPTPVQFTSEPKKFSRAGDLLFCVRGSTTGRMNWSDRQYAIGRGLAAIRHKTNTRLNPLLRGIIENQLPLLLGQATGSTFPNVSADQIRTIPWPDLAGEAELAASNILAAFDDKIELNRKMNQTLESMARALFKSWFIDFDPVRAKMDGRWKKGQSLPGLPAELWDLFPDSFSEIKKDQWPQGWNAGSLNDIASIKAGYAFKSSSFLESGHPVVKIKNITDDYRVDLNNVDYVSAETVTNLDAFKLFDSDIVMAMTGATVGKFGLIVQSTGLVPYLNQRVALIRPKLGLKNAFVYFCLRASDAYEQIVNRAAGSAQPNISSDGIGEATVLVPPRALIAHYNNICQPTVAKIISNLKENVILINSRDSLLPKLISGEVRITA